MSIDAEAFLGKYGVTIVDAVGPALREHFLGEPVDDMLLAHIEAIYVAALCKLVPNGSSPTWMKFVANPDNSIGPGNLATALAMRGQVVEGLDLDALGDTYEDPNGMTWLYRDGKVFIKPVKPMNVINMTFAVELDTPSEASGDTEEAAMQAFLDGHPCPCGEKRQFSGGALYSDPLQWLWVCRICGRAGSVGFSDLRGEEIVITP